jgi:hypothetical protein
LDIGVPAEKPQWSKRKDSAYRSGRSPIAADNPGSFIDTTPTAKLVRQVLGAISEFDKAMTVAKLRGARERKRRGTGKCEGRKSHAERNPELVALAKRLHRHKPKGGACRCGRSRPSWRPRASSTKTAAHLLRRPSGRCWIDYTKRASKIVRVLR